MANLALDEIAGFIDECNPTVVSRFRSTGPGDADLQTASPTVESYFKPSGSNDLSGYTPPGGGGGEGGSGKSTYPYVST